VPSIGDLRENYGSISIGDACESGVTVADGPGVFKDSGVPLEIGYAGSNATPVSLIASSRNLRLYRNFD
jgi:hypothetical protein